MTTNNPSPEHRERLAALADLLDTVEAERFDMGLYYTGGDLENPTWPVDAVDLRTECGTAGCTLGYAPSLYPPLADELWEVYAARVFGLGIGRIWIWVFSSRWQYIDNTPRGAAARIRYLLEHGLPEDWRQQMSWEKPLCYEVTEGTAP